MSIKQIDAISVAAYGVQTIDLGPLGAMWLAALINERDGINVYKRISNYRNKHGKGTDFPCVGSKLFKTM